MGLTKINRGFWDEETGEKNKRVYVSDTEIHRLIELMPHVLTEWETTNNIILTHSEVARRVIYIMWRRLIER
jgi:hypothetical protein